MVVFDLDLELLVEVGVELNRVGISFGLLGVFLIVSRFLFGLKCNAVWGGLLGIHL